MQVVYLEPGSEPWFPDPSTGREEGLLAVGGDLSVERVLLAYDLGIFPWYSDSELPLWWSPDPRAILELGDLHISRSLKRRLQKGGFRLTWNRCFGEVIHQCSMRRDDGTWIHEEVEAAYKRLHELGHAHSLEVWMGEELVGGLYGVQRGAFFAAESKFHRRRDMSKIALVAALRSLSRAGVELFDVQMTTPYLESFGVKVIPRERYLDRLRASLAKPLDLRHLEPQSGI